MSKDYVRKPPVKQRSQLPKLLVLVLFSFLCGYLTATIFDFTSLSTWVNKQVADNNKPVAEGKNIAKAHVVKPKFEFYTLLAKDNSLAPKHNVAAPIKPAQQSTVASQSSTQVALQAAKEAQQVSNTVATVNQEKEASLAQQINQANMLANRRNKEAFLIQIAAFNKRQDAEQLKASLLLRGFDATISPFLKEHTNWYRVNVGPFLSRADAEKAQLAVVKSEHIKGLIRKIDV